MVLTSAPSSISSAPASRPRSLGYGIASLAALSLAGLASPSIARNTGPYAGIEGGVAFPRSLHGNATVDAPTVQSVCLPGRPLCEQVPEHFDAGDVFGSRLKHGKDVDIIAGYDFGPFRLEGELGWKRLAHRGGQADPEFLDYFNAILRRPLSPPEPGAPGLPALTGSDLGTVRGKVVARSAMVNLLGDLPGPMGITLYGGGGVGRTWAKALNDSDSAWAAQGIAGVRILLASNIELGLKYRYFRTGRMNFSGSPVEFTGNQYVAYAGGIQFNKQDLATISPKLSGHLQTHSLLVSFIFNFGRGGE